MSDDAPEATPYTVYVFDCPSCGGPTTLGEDYPSATEECSGCGIEVAMA